nr:G-type lectin S-receptor-like serine/threonine-protein kinase At4g27290 [Ipomoea batatas]
MLTLPLLISLTFLVSILSISIALDTISSTQFLKDGHTIVSSGGMFEMGFFSPANSQNRYVGIWYNQIPTRTVVWVANRDTPLTNTSSVVLKIVDPGRLALVDDANTSISDASDEKAENLLWQSFDHPTDTLLPGINSGRISLLVLKQLYRHGRYPQLIIRKGIKEVFRTGPWNGVRWSGLSGMVKRRNIAEIFVIINMKEASVSFKVYNNRINSSILLRMVLSNSGSADLCIWAGGGWNLIRKAATDVCDKYGSCGTYGRCDSNIYPNCRCLDRFLARNPGAWGRGDFSGGCVRRTLLKNCQNGSLSSSDGFLKYSGVKLPDTRFSAFNTSMNLQECRQVCLKNCSCMAYSSLDISNGENGCLLWFRDLIDISAVPSDGFDQDLYIRMGLPPS